jgi:hypothetical protein
MTCPGEELLDALKTRLESIRVENGYPLTVKKVLVSHNQISINVDSMTCPMIEVVQGVEQYAHAGLNGMVTKVTDIGLRLVGKKGDDDKFMERFKSAVVRCIYCNGYDKQGNDGIRLSRQVVMPKLVQTVPDYGVIEANRVYVMVFEIESTTQTWSF